jgi:hypothetical protein
MNARTNVEGAHDISVSQLIKEGDIYHFPIGKNDNVIYNVLTADGYNPAKIMKDHSHCHALGFMQSSRDWKNVEMTIYVKGLSPGQGKLSLRCRGGKRHDKGNVPDCEGFAYMANIYGNGTITLAKEQFNGHLYETDPKHVAGSLEDMWVGVKFCVYNSNDRNVDDKSVILEIHLDLGGNNNWIESLQFIDKGGWGNHDDICNGVTSDQIGTWGGPVTTFQWENFDILLFKWFSVREIDPFIPFNESGANATVLHGYGGLGSTGSGGIIRP